MARWLERCARPQPWEQALRAETGWDVAGLESAVQAEVVDRFPADPLAAPGYASGAQ